MTEDTETSAETPPPEADRERAARRRARRRARREADAMPVVAPKGEQQHRVVTAELVPPSPRGGLREVLQQRFLLKLIVRRQLAQMYSASLLGLMWSYVQPALRFLVYYFAIGMVLQIHKDVPNFALHLFAGMVFVHYFGETWNGGTRSIWTNRSLVQKMRMPREVFPVAAMVTALYHTLPQMLVLVIACATIGWTPSWEALAALALGLALIVVFAMALGLFFSAANVFARDFQNIVQTVMQFMHFLVPMIYPFERIWAAHDSHRVLYEIYVANPVAQGVMLMQRTFWYPTLSEEQRGEITQAFPPDQWVRGVVTLLVSLVLLWLAQRFFSRVENKFPERL